MKLYALIITLLFSSFTVQSQCLEGETEVFVNVFTDNWGYETYWELGLTGQVCGEAPLFQGGNLVQVGCEGGGEQDSGGGNGYANNETFSEGPFCLMNGEEYDINFIDDWGDGGLIFELIQDGVLTSFFQGSGQGNTFTFTAGDLTPAFIDGDRPCDSFSVEIDGASVVLENTEATTSPGEISPPEGFCGAYGQWCDSNNGPSNTMWVTFVPETDGAFEVSSCNELNDFDTAIAVYQVEDCSDFSTYTLLSSNDDAYIGCSEGSTGYASTCYVSCLNPGETYYIQLDGWGGAVGTSEITVTTHLGEPEENSYLTDVQCANVKGDTGSGIVPQINGLGINYSVVWEGPNDFTSEERTLENVPSGEYTCVITNECGYVFTETYTVASPEVIVPNFTGELTSCEELEDGTILTDISGGAEPYDVIWSGPESFQSFEPNLENIGVGTYFVEIEDDNGCEYQFQYTISAGNSLEFSLGVNPTLCLDETTEFIAPPGFFLYEWQDGSENSNYTFSAEESGVGLFPITLTILDAVGCSHTDVVNVTVENCLGIYDYTSEDFGLYPNPSTGKVNFIPTESALLQGRVLVFDSAGKEVYNADTEISNAIDLSFLSQGVYSVMITTKEGTFKNKLILSE